MRQGFLELLLLHLTVIQWLNKVKLEKLWLLLLGVLLQEAHLLQFIYYF